MNHVALDTQNELVKQFVLSLPINPQGAVLELNGEAVAWVVPAGNAITNGNEPWTDVKNARRCELIDRKYVGGITAQEAAELGVLQEQMLHYRQRVAPLPLDDARRLHQSLLAKAIIAQRHP